MRTFILVLESKTTLMTARRISDMKKVAVIWSSPNKDGLTASTKDRYIEGLKTGGTEVEEIHLNSRKIEHCRACS